MSKPSLVDTVFKYGILVDLSISRWTGIKKLASEDLKLPENAINTAVHLGHKKLVDKEAMSPLASVESAARTYLNSRSMPFPISGVRFVPLSIFPEIIQKLTEYKEIYLKNVDIFMGSYESMRSRVLLQLDQVALEAADRDMRLKIASKNIRPTDAELKQFSDDAAAWMKAQSAANMKLYPRKEELYPKFRFEWSIFQIESGPLSVLDNERQELLSAGRKALEKEVNSWVQEAIVSIHVTLGEAATNACELLAKNGKITKKTLEPLFGAFELFKNMEITGSSPFRKTIADLEALVERGADGKIDYKATADSSAKMKSLLESMSTLIQQDVAESVGVKTINKSDEFFRVVEF